MSKGRTKVIQEEIEICIYCDGHGLYGQHLTSPVDVRIKNIHFKDLNLEEKKKYVIVNCENCEGKGRMLKTTTIEWTTLK